MAITKDANATMSYKNYEADIVVKYGVELQGWTHSTWRCPAKLSTSLAPLRTLLDALISGQCRFVRLSKTEHAARKAEYDHKVKTGEIVPRKQRSDAGKLRSKRKKSKSTSKSVAEDSDDDEDGGSSSDDEDGGDTRSRKRRRTNPKSAEIVEDSD